MAFVQARWREPLIFERSKRGKLGHLPPQPDEAEKASLPDPVRLIPSALLRKHPPELPEVSEIEVVRHFTRLSQQNYGVDLGIYPLGSCTMKYNPKICEAVVRTPKLQMMHPYQGEAFAQGVLELMFRLSAILCELTGMHKFSLQPAAGSSAEFTGILIMRAYQRLKGELDKRTEIIVPDSAHGSNPASASMGGFKVVVVPSDDEGCVDIGALRKAVGPQTAGLMLTNPNTLGVFERNISEISDIVHEAGGLLYYDGANLNAIVGKARPGDMGFDLVHLNLHKTFSTPHGGGGPGAGPIGVTEELEQFLPAPTVEYDGSRYYLQYDRPHSVGKVRGFYGKVPVLVRAYAYILSLGAEGLEETAELAVLNANYLLRKVLKSGDYELPYAPQKPRKHEFVISAGRLARETGVHALDISKRLLDHGLHAPSMYFPLIVEEALMVEPTETTSKEELDEYARALNQISREARNNSALVAKAPHNAAVERVDEAKASHPRTMCLSWRALRSRGQGANSSG